MIGTKLKFKIQFRTPAGTFNSEGMDLELDLVDPPVAEAETGEEDAKKDDDSSFKLSPMIGSLVAGAILMFDM